MMHEELLGFNIWTKNQPQPYLDAFAAFAAERGAPLVAVVDDVLPAVVFDRSDDEIRQKNDAYEAHMKAAGYDSVHFVSDLLPDRGRDLTDLVAMCGRVSVSAFQGLLPQKKIQMIESLGLNEVIDAGWQLHVLETGIAQTGITTWLTGKRSTALFRLAKATIPDFSFSTID